MKKRGISSIVVIIIIILITLAAIPIIWKVAKPMISDKSEESKARSELLLVNLKIDEDNTQVMEKQVMLKIKRDVGQGEFGDRILIIAENASGTYIFNVTTDIKVFESEFFQINITNVTKISIAPVYITETNKEIVGDIKDTIEIGEISPPALPPIPAPEYIKFVSPTPISGTTTSPVTINMTIRQAENRITQINLVWNSTSYSFYDSSLRLFMNLDNNANIGETSTNAVDSSQYSNNGSFSGNTVWTTGRYMNAANFDGSGDYITLINENNFDFERTNAFSGCAWIYPSTTALNAQMIMSKINIAADYSGWEFGLYDGANSDSLWVLLMNSYSGTNYISRYSTNDIIANQWQHVCFSYDGSSSNAGINLYRNGNLITTTTAGGALTASILNNKAVQIGERDGTLPFSGRIDEVRVWSRTLTSSEIYQQYAGNLRKYNTTYWNFNSLQSGLVSGRTYTCQGTMNSQGILNSTEIRNFQIS